MANRVRNSAKAIIINDGRILVARMKRDGEVFYLLPGGGQEPGETLVEAVRRECLEEIGVEPEVGELLFVRDYIGTNHEFAETQSHFHQVEFMFACAIDGSYTPRAGSEPDFDQDGVEWLDLETIATLELYPRSLAPHLAALGAQTSSGGVVANREHAENVRPVYLGDVN